MAITFLIPGPLRQFAGGHAQVEVSGAYPTLRETFAALCKSYPGLRDRVLTEQGEIRQHVNLFVDNECVRYTRGLETPVPDGSEVSIIPAITGG